MHGNRRIVEVFLLTAFLIAAVIFIAAVALIMAPLYLHEESIKYPGSYAPLYLNKYAPYDRIVIEVHYQDNAKPSPYALEHLQSLLHRYSGKAVNLYEYGDIGPDMIPEAADSNNLSSFGYDIVERNAHYRTGWLSGNATIYVLYIDLAGHGSLHNGTGVVAGMSYRADSFFVFDNYIYDEETERTVLMHEAGHLLGLEHDADPGCAMTGTLARNRYVRMGPVSTPDDFCEEHQKQIEYARYHLI